MHNPVDITEAAYDVATSDVVWLTRVAEACRPALDAGFGVRACLVQVDFAQRKLDLASPVVTVGNAPELGEMLACRLRDLGPSFVRPEHLNADRTITSASESFIVPDGTKFEEWGEYSASRRLGVMDYLNARSFDSDGRGVMIDAGLPSVTRTTPQQVDRWRSVSVHLSAGIRLRRLLGEEVARVDGRGRVHAVSDAVNDDDLQTVREAARAIGTARGALRNDDPERAMELWQGLVSGRWSMVDHFESDGRRYLVARRNEPMGLPLPGLSSRERQVLAYVAMGRSNKHVAYTLGLTPSTVSDHLTSAFAKLGIAGREDLLRLIGAVWKPRSAPS